MKHWVVTRKSDGEPVHRYQSEQPIEWHGMEFATHDHTETAGEPEPAPLPRDPRWITNLAFRKRFTRTEKGVIELASLDNPSASAAQRLAAAELRADLADQEQATYIDLDRADTRAGVIALEAAGLIAPGRALQILDAEVQPMEVYRG